MDEKRDERKEKWWSDWRLVRNVTLFVFGLMGTIVMTVLWAAFNRSPDLSLLTFFGGMLGLPLFLIREDK